ncbi:MAG: hypothetical protein DDT42_00306 [candidate division WS2 bacterium]|uniref:Uncharacterized protein n=1 Tax=Psychracetigena formicireducens TaxID=2986056 RepID=A0A9E2F5K8_PSYF1|nr:hypothetical protein [Candidatus Psychracetigena formicireducens]MBT9144465.1 hypothetical protein [Candidatus Psychracetigena formicireducens]
MKPPLHITQHKRFVPYGTYPNPALICVGRGQDEKLVLGFFYAGTVN